MSTRQLSAPYGFQPVRSRPLKRGTHAAAGPRALGEEREELTDLLAGGLAAVFADLEGFRVADLRPALGPVPLDEPGPEPVGGGGEVRGPVVA